MGASTVGKRPDDDGCRETAISHRSSVPPRTSSAPPSISSVPTATGKAPTSLLCCTAGAAWSSGSTESITLLRCDGTSDTVHCVFRCEALNESDVAQTRIAALHLHLLPNDSFGHDEMGRDLEIQHTTCGQRLRVRTRSVTGKKEITSASAPNRYTGRARTHVPDGWLYLVRKRRGMRRPTYDSAASPDLEQRPKVPYVEQNLHTIRSLILAYSKIDTIVRTSAYSTFLDSPRHYLSKVSPRLTQRLYLRSDLTEASSCDGKAIAGPYSFVSWSNIWNTMVPITS
nr:hypothetical protein CFP56_30967 [Quercus suber]